MCSNISHVFFLQSFERKKYRYINGAKIHKYINGSCRFEGVLDVILMVVTSRCDDYIINKLILIFVYILISTQILIYTNIIH